MFSSSIFSQETSINRTYNTQEYESNIQFSSTSKNEIETQYFDFKKNPKLLERNINIIFHVLWNNQSQRLSQSTLENEIALLNNNFSEISFQSGHQSDPKGLYKSSHINDSQIEFCLISSTYLRRNVENINQVNYQNTSQKYWDINNDMKYDSKGGLDIVLPENILNIWIVNLEDSNAGFAQMPGNNSKTDGIVIDYQYISGHRDSHDEYSQGATLTHLIGNYLNLYDLWNPNCEDDKVSDTPIHNAPNYGCPEFAHLSSCDPNAFVVEMSMNYMDNTNDECQYMFTHGQVVRMQAILSEDGYRNNLTETLNCSSEEGIEEPIVESRSTENEDIDEDVIIYPNPTENGIWIELSNSKVYKIQILNQAGKVFYNGIFKAPNRKYIDLKAIATPGIYFVSFTSENESKTKKIILQ